MRFLLFPLLLLPVLELVLLIKVGAVIGAWNVIGLLILFAFAGFSVIRYIGISVALSMRQKMAVGIMPAEDMMNNIVIILGGILLIVPGFITDFSGLLLLIPFTRHLLLKIGLRVTEAKFSASSAYSKSSSYRAEPNVYDGEFEETTEEQFNRQRRERHVSHTVIDGEYTRKDSDPHRCKL